MTDPSAWEIVLLAVLGLLSGAVNAIAGGGSLIVFPALLAVGLPPLAANVTNSVAQWPSYAGSTLGARSDLRGQGHRLTATSLVSLAGAVLGCGLLLVLPQTVFDAVVPVLVLLASLLLGVRPYLMPRAPDGDDGDDGDPASDRTRWLLPAIFASAVYGGYFGGAQGVVLIAVLSALCSDTLRRLNATKAALSLVVGTVTVVIFAVFAPVQWLAVVLLAPATLVGGYGGMLVARRMPEPALRWSVVVLGVAVAIYLFLR